MKVIQHSPQTPLVVIDGTGKPVPPKEAVKRLLTHIGWDQTKLAEHCGISYRTALNYSNGSSVPSRKILLALKAEVDRTSGSVEVDKQAEVAFGTRPWSIRFPQGRLAWTPDKPAKAPAKA